MNNMLIKIDYNRYIIIDPAKAGALFEILSEASVYEDNHKGSIIRDLTKDDLTLSFMSESAIKTIKAEMLLKGA